MEERTSHKARNILIFGFLPSALLWLLIILLFFGEIGIVIIILLCSMLGGFIGWQAQVTLSGEETELDV